MLFDHREKSYLRYLFTIHYYLPKIDKWGVKSEE